MSLPAGGSLVLAPWQRYAIYACVVLVTATGVGWLLVSPDEGADTDAASRNAAIWLLRGHGIGAYALLVAAGTALPMHVRLGWARRRNRWSGSVLVAVLLALATTGLWLYYGPPAARAVVSALHWIVGLALPAWLLLHRLWGLRSRRRDLS